MGILQVEPPGDRLAAGEAEAERSVQAFWWPMACAIDELDYCIFYLPTLGEKERPHSRGNLGTYFPAWSIWVLPIARVIRVIKVFPLGSC